MNRNGPSSYRPAIDRSHRHAITLIEVIGTLAVLLVLAVSAASILGGITEIGNRDGNAKQGRATVERLAKVFRDDVHLASEVTLADDQWPLLLTTDAGPIRYEWHDDSHSIGRTVGDGDQPLFRDQFRLTDFCDPRVVVDDERVTVVLHDTPPRNPWIIEASRQP